MSDRPVITLRDFVIEYPSFQLGPIDLEVRPGEEVALFGLNGAGKSTLLRALSGRLPQFSGHAEICGHSLEKHRSSIRSLVGYADPDVPGYAWMSVEQYLEFIGALHPHWDAGYALDLRTLFQLPGETPIANLSKGMRSRLSLIGALAHNPQLLMLDEPVTGLDPLARTQMLHFIDSAREHTSGLTLLFATHQAVDLHQIGQRILLMHNGEVIRETSFGEALLGGDPQHWGDDGDHGDEQEERWFDA